MLSRDLRLAVRGLLKRPGFALVAASTLALGVGANTAIFSVLNTVLLRPLDYPDAERLVKISGLDTSDGTKGNLSPADFMDFERESTSFERMGAHGWVGFFTITGNGSEPERVGGVNVTGGFFPTLGVRPALGRLFLPEEDLPGGPEVALLSYGFWKRRYGSDPDIVGKTITVNAVATTVVGVLPENFRHVEANPERAAEVFAPYQFERASPNRGGHFIRGAGRLKGATSLEAARTELTAFAKRLEEQYPADNTDQGVALDPLHAEMVRASRPALLLLAGAVGFVLLVACANVANLSLASGAARQKEIALRTALGATRGGLIRQMLAESAVLAAVGTAAGLAMALVATRALRALASASVPRADEIRIDGAVLVFTLLTAGVTVLLFGLVPALQLSRARLGDALREGTRGGVRQSLRRGTRDLLIVGEVALSLVLLVGAGLLITSFFRLESVPPGFETDSVVTLQAALPTATYAEGDQIPFYEELIERIRALPNVREVGAVNILPLTNNYDGRGFQVEDHPAPIGQAPGAQARSCHPAYFRAMGIRLLRGREFTAEDREGRPRVVIVSESMAKRFWPGQDALGRRITFNSGIPREIQQTVGGPGSREIVGIVGDVKHLGLDEAEAPMFYTPHAQQPSYHTMTLVVRAAGVPATLVAGVRRELRQMDPDVPVSQVRTLNDVVSSSLSAPRFRAQLLGLFAAVSLALAAVGVYGVVGYVASQRTHELGVRAALGARERDLLALVVTQGMAPVVLGTAIGLGGALLLSRTVSRLLFGIASTDSTTYAAVSILLTTVALAATIIPARRAARVDPTVALRME